MRVLHDAPAGGLRVSGHHLGAEETSGWSRSGLTAAKGLNMGLKISKLFLPAVPTVPDGTISKIAAFTESLGQDTLDAMPEVQSYVDATAASMDTGKGTAVADADYCKRQFEVFLAQQDPTRDYAGLNRVQGQYESIYVI